MNIEDATNASELIQDFENGFFDEDELQSHLNEMNLVYVFPMTTSTCLVGDKKEKRTYKLDIETACYWAA